MGDWKHYFDTRHEGLGTTYERFVLNTYFSRLRNQYGVDTVLEAPLFGMTGISGINSMWWARHGAKVTLVDHNRERLILIKRIWADLSLKLHVDVNQGTYASLPFQDEEFDLSWNFAAVHTLPNAGDLLRELARVTRKVIWIAIPNPLNLFKLVCGSMKDPKSSAKQAELSLMIVADAMTKAGWRLRESGYFDVPPWPDIAMSREECLRKIGLTQIAGRLEKGINRENRICILDYYSGRNPKMKQEMCRYGRWENSPRWVKKVWAHHRYFLFAPPNDHR